MISNDILYKCIENNPNYCHVIEVEDVSQLQCIIESIVDENWDKKNVIEFFNTIQIYCTVDENEDEVYSFEIEEFINTLY